MNVKDLKKLLEECPDEVEVVMVDDQEGNEYIRHSLIEYACINLWDSDLQNDPNIEKVYDLGDEGVSEDCTKILVLWS